MFFFLGGRSLIPCLSHFLVIFSLVFSEDKAAVAHQIINRLYSDVVYVVRRYTPHAH